MAAYFHRFKAASGVGLFYLARFAPGLLNLLLVLLLSHKLSAADYGKFSIWFAICMSGGYFFFGWISQSIARYANAHDDLLGQAPEVFALAVIFSAATMFVLGSLFSYSFLHGTNWFYGTLMAASVMLHGVHIVVSSAQQARMRFCHYVAVEISRPLCAVFSCVSIVFGIKASYGYAMAGYVFGQGIGVLFVTWLFRRHIKQVLPRVNTLLHRWRETAAILQKLFIYGSPISMWLASTMAWPAAERRVLGLLSNANEVGLYSSEYDVAFRSFVFILLPITLFAQPHIFKAYSNSELAKVNKIIRQSLVTLVIVGVAYAVAYVSVIFLVLQKYGLFAGMQPTTVSVLCLAAVSWQAALLCHKWLECTKSIGLMVAFLLLVYALIAIPVSLFFYSKLGAAAFAVGSLISGISYSIASLFVGKRRAFALRKKNIL